MNRGNLTSKFAVTWHVGRGLMAGPFVRIASPSSLRRFVAAVNSFVGEARHSSGFSASEEIPLEDQGLVTLESAFSVSETIDRLVGAVDAAGLLVFARIDHGQGAADVGASLRPTQLLVFGHPRGGTPLMQERQTAGIDLPLKALAWEDENGRVWLTYDSAAWIRERHGLGEQSSNAVGAIEAGLSKLASTATTNG